MEGDAALQFISPPKKIILEWQLFLTIKKQSETISSRIHLKKSDLFSILYYFHVVFPFFLSLFLSIHLLSNLSWTGLYWMSFGHTDRQY